MKIETKFDVGQFVWVNIPYVNDWCGKRKVINKAELHRIEAIRLTATENYFSNIDAIYILENVGECNEFCLFATQEEAEAKLKEIKDGTK